MQSHLFFRPVLLLNPLCHPLRAFPHTLFTFYTPFPPTIPVAPLISCPCSLVSLTFLFQPAKTQPRPSLDPNNSPDSESEPTHTGSIPLHHAAALLGRIWPGREQHAFVPRRLFVLTHATRLKFGEIFWLVNRSTRKRLEVFCLRQRNGYWRRGGRARDAD